MVSTRGHPQAFPEPELSPSKTSTRGRKASKWAHTPSTTMLVWLFASLPLIAWDAGYVMLRPHSMPGGSLHKPLWQPYELYGKIDYIYGWKAFNEKNGFTAAQTFLNLVESSMYLYYLYSVYAHGKPSGAGAKGGSSSAGLLGQRVISGRQGAMALLVAHSALVMTFSKTVLYWMNEYYSGFTNIGHNSVQDLIFLWIIPNGAWLVLPAYLIYDMGGEIIQGLISEESTPVKSE